jgi:hypothetical protein
MLLKIIGFLDCAPNRHSPILTGHNTIIFFAHDDQTRVMVGLNTHSSPSSWEVPRLTRTSASATFVATASHRYHTSGISQGTTKDGDNTSQAPVRHRHRSEEPPELCTK